MNESNICSIFSETEIGIEIERLPPPGWSEFIV
jgi:hypothetical protein